MESTAALNFRSSHQLKCSSAPSLSSAMETARLHWRRVAERPPSPPPSSRLCCVPSSSLFRAIEQTNMRKPNLIGKFAAFNAAGEQSPPPPPSSSDCSITVRKVEGNWIRIERRDYRQQFRSYPVPAVPESGRHGRHPAAGSAVRRPRHCSTTKERHQPSCTPPHVRQIPNILPAQASEHLAVTTSAAWALHSAWGRWGHRAGQAQIHVARYSR